jgi:Flp pilus assembly protein TadD
MKHHRVIWSFTLAVALAACLIVTIRSLANRGNDTAAADLLIARMLDLLTEDPRARHAESRAVIETLAALAESGADRRAETLYALGMRAWGRRELAIAESAFQEAIELKPEWAWPYNALGIVYYQREWFDEAKRLFHQASELDPDWSRPHNDLAVLLRHESYLQEGPHREALLAEAEREALAALERDPNGLATNNNYGNLLVELGRMDEAEDAYQRALAADPHDPAPHYNLACLASLQGRVDSALVHLEQAFELDPAFRAEAFKDEDLDRIRDDPRFQALL